MSFFAENPRSVNQKPISGTLYEKLFLLEILVNDVYIKNSCINQNLTSKCQDTKVLFQFLYFPPVTVCEDICSAAPQPSPITHIKFKSGKLCLFPLRPMNCPVLPTDFNINISVVKNIQEGIIQKQLVIGKAKINMGSFYQLINDYLPANVITPSKTMRDTVDLIDDCGGQIGNISFFLRLTYLKTAIVTKVSTGTNQEALLFQGSVDLNLLETKDILKPEKPYIEYNDQQRQVSSLFQDRNKNQHNAKKRCFCPCAVPKIRPRCNCND